MQKYCLIHLGKHFILKCTDKMIGTLSGSEESLWWLINIYLTSRGDNLTSHKIIYFTSRGDNSLKFWAKTNKVLYEPSITRCFEPIDHWKNKRQWTSHVSEILLFLVALEFCPGSKRSGI